MTSFPVRVSTLAGAVLAVGLLTGACKKSSPTPPATFCSDAKSASKTCTTPSDCDGVLTTACASLNQVVSGSTLAAAQNCLESGVCGPASCLSSGQVSAAPGTAHKQLASDYCSSCAPDDATCTADFYAHGKKLPGLLALPYADAIVTQIDQQCTGTAGCAATFATCLNGVVTQAASGALDPATANCVVQGFQHDVASTTGPGGAPVVANCTPQNCQGCCKDDTCEDGKAANACGAAGGACSACGGDQQCMAGACKEPCGPNNCRGCCSNGVCVDGNETATCGGGGVACTACATPLVCSNRTCIDGSCQATCLNGCCSATGCQPGTAANACGTGGEACVDCGTGRTCTSNACVLDPTSLWDFYVSFATIPGTDKSGSTWNFDGQPDPYLKAYASNAAGAHTGQTSTQLDTTTPFWGETPLTGIAASELMSNLSFEIWNSGLITDSLIGGCAITAGASIFDGSLQSIDCPPTASGEEVTLYYRINPH